MGIMNDNFVTVKLQGGLGNYLFQLSAAIFISIRDEKKLIIDELDIVNIHSNINIYKENFFKNVKFSSLVDYQIFNEESFYYKEIPKIENSIKLIGYFQSEKYFKDIRPYILSLFEMNNDTSSYLDKKYLKNIKMENTCSIHVRRGNYLNKVDWHPVLPIEYYKNATKFFDNETHFLIFSDDIPWCKENFNFLKNIIFIEDNLDYQDLYLMSKCKNNIIANSSFSWWGAWLNQNEEKKIICPNLWFGPSGFKDLHDLRPFNWIKI